MGAPDGIPRDVGVRQALDLINAGAVVIDVRRPAEYLRGHAVRSRNVPLDELRAADYAGRVVVCVCAHGNRSGAAADRLRAAGIDACVLAGGLAAWARSGQPLIALGGGQGEVA